MEFFPKIFNSLRLLSVFAEISILDVWLGSWCTHTLVYITESKSSGFISIFKLLTSFCFILKIGHLFTTIKRWSLEPSQTSEMELFANIVSDSLGCKTGSLIWLCVGLHYATLMEWFWFSFYFFSLLWCYLIHREFFTAFLWYFNVSFESILCPFHLFD